MKLFFSLLFISNIICAREIIVIKHNQNKEKALLVKKVILEQYNLPSQFIGIKQSNNCTQNSNDNLLVICTNKQQLEFPVLKRKKINKIISMFLKIQS